MGDAIATYTVSQLFENAVNAVQTNVMDMVQIALPAGLVIMGTFLAIRLGVGFFKSIAH